MRLKRKTSVTIATGKHLFPSRTQQLSPSAPMVLGWQRSGRVGHRRGLFFCPKSSRLSVDLSWMLIAARIMEPNALFLEHASSIFELAARVRPPFPGLRTRASVITDLHHVGGGHRAAGGLDRVRDRRAGHPSRSP